MKYLSILISALLVGCSTVPVKQKFPNVPVTMTQECSNLAIIEKPNAVLSDLITKVNENYMQYYICAATVASWQDWYVKQKKIFEEANK